MIGAEGEEQKGKQQKKQKQGPRWTYARPYQVQTHDYFAAIEDSANKRRFGVGSLLTEGLVVLALTRKARQPVAIVAKLADALLCKDAAGADLLKFASPRLTEVTLSAAPIDESAEVKAALELCAKAAERFASPPAKSAASPASSNAEQKRATRGQRLSFSPSKQAQQQRGSSSGAAKPKAAAKAKVKAKPKAKAKSPAKSGDWDEEEDDESASESCSAAEDNDEEMVRAAPFACLTCSLALQCLFSGLNSLFLSSAGRNTSSPSYSSADARCKAQDGACVLDGCTAKDCAHLCVLCVDFYGQPPVDGAAGQPPRAKKPKLTTAVPKTKQARGAGSATQPAPSVNSAASVVTVVEEDAALDLDTLVKLSDACVRCLRLFVQLAAHLCVQAVSGIAAARARFGG